MKNKGMRDEISFVWMKHRLRLNRTGASIYSIIPMSDTPTLGVIISVILCCFVATMFPILIGAFNIAYLLRNKLI